MGIVRFGVMKRGSGSVGTIAAAVLIVAWAPQGPAVYSLAPSLAAGESLDITRSRVAFPQTASPRVRKAVEMLVDETAKRSHARWESTPAWPGEGAPVVAVGLASALGALAPRIASRLDRQSGEAKPEGYRLLVDGEGAGAIVIVAGNDERGVLFGVGRLLRALRMRKGRVEVPGDLAVASSPGYPLRGHQLGYRPKTNSYDGWTIPLWEQYIRDLAVFGTNAVELIPPRSDDDADSPHFPVPPLEMMVGMSRLLDAYGLDVWIWYPAMDPDYSDPKTVERALAEWGEVFRRLPRIDAVFVPGGDPGHTRPRVLMALLEKQEQSLRRHHPRAEMWVSPQSFSQEWLDEFLGILRSQSPAWLHGVVFGPQVRGSLARLRESVPARYAIRDYPDITHSRQCQFPVPEWDTALAVTAGREGINPRPRGQAAIFRRLSTDAIGFITYSEGCNDDVNKVVWSALGWDPGADLREVLREYARFFIGDPLVEDFAEGLFLLERNWEGPLRLNEGVESTLERFHAMERSASPAQLLSWRFQQGLYRAYYDSYVRNRLIHETTIENEAMAALGKADETGSLQALAKAGAVLDRIGKERVSADRRARVFELAEALFQSIRMQLSVERYKAISVGRGANLDTIDVPLVAVRWLRARIEEARKLPSEAERLAGISAILHRTDPGPGGFYDDLGDPGHQLHLVKGPGFERDPSFLESALVSFAVRLDGPVAWWHHAESLQDAPLQMRYTGLDPKARYCVRAVYGGETPGQKIRLLAGDIEVHPFLSKPSPIQPLEFDIPPEATAGGELILSWRRAQGLGGNGRGCQVSEVWLLKR